MTARNYDVILNFYGNSPNGVGTFEAGNVIIGNTSVATGTIANIDLSSNTIKVKLSNSSIRFTAGENVHSNVSTARVINTEFDINNSNTVGNVVNDVNFTALYSNLQSARGALRTAGNTFTEVAGNAYILPVEANSKNEITVLIGNTQIHSEEYIWTGDLSSGIEQPVHFGGNVQLNSQSVFNVTLTSGSTRFANNIVVFKYERPAKDTNVKVRVATANLIATSFQPAVYTGNTTTAISTNVLAVTNSPYIAEKNAFTQNPIVRLIDIYYPGEWYPTNSKGNPTNQGAGVPWPNNFPFKIAEINGDIISDINYNVTHGGGSYSPYPLNVGAIEQSSDGQINELSVTIFNLENTLSALVEDPFLAGNNKNNSAMAIVNGEYLNGIDPRTINMDAVDISNWSGFPNYESSAKETANLAANILFGLRVIQKGGANIYNYNATAVGIYGKSNAAWTRDQVSKVDGAGLANWQERKLDSRDLLGGVVVIKSTFANFLDYWPEYSTIKSILGNAYEMTSTMPYRIGDNVKSSKGDTEATIEGIEENRFLFLSNTVDSSTLIDDPLYIINTDADPESYLEDVFKINSLESLNDVTATFSLTSWLQYFKFALPKRKFYKNTCQWEYKGSECQYPGPPTDTDATVGLPIPGSDKKGNADPIYANNISAGADLSGDICGKSLLSCQIRNNDIHFGGFPATGRTIPRQ